MRIDGKKFPIGSDGWRGLTLLSWRRDATMLLCVVGALTAEELAGVLAGVLEIDRKRAAIRCYILNHDRAHPGMDDAARYFRAGAPS